MQFLHGNATSGGGRRQSRGQERGRGTSFRPAASRDVRIAQLTSTPASPSSSPAPRRRRALPGPAGQNDIVIRMQVAVPEHVGVEGDAVSGRRLGWSALPPKASARPLISMTICMWAPPSPMSAFVEAHVLNGDAQRRCAGHLLLEVAGRHLVEWRSCESNFDSSAAGMVIAADITTGPAEFPRGVTRRRPASRCASPSSTPRPAGPTCSPRRPQWPGSRRAGRSP